MPLNIGFRITGMFFGAKDSVTKEIRVDVPKDNPTVYDVMVEVVKKVNRGEVSGVSGFLFDPIFPSEIDSLKSVTLQYSSAPKEPYEAGTYFLQENKMGNPIYVFQYYIFDKDFKQKNDNNKTKNFNQTPDDTIVDNDTVIWRQIAIMQGKNGNNQINNIMKKTMKNLTDKNLI